MAEKRCGLGFGCASMMQQSELRIAKSVIAKARELAAQSSEIE